MIIISDHDIEDGEQLAHTGSEGHLLGLASGTQTLVEGSNHRVEAGGYESGHEESGPYLSTAAPDGSLTPQGPAVSIEGSHSNQSCDLTAVEGPQLRQVGQEGGAKYRAHPRSTPQQVVFGSPEGTGTDEVGAVPQATPRAVSLLAQCHCGKDVASDYMELVAGVQS